MHYSFFLIGVIFALVTGEAVDKWYRGRDGSRFYIEKDNKFNWYNAWNECVRKNMSLMAIDSARKNWILETLLKDVMPTVVPSLWLSGTDMGIDKRYEWSTTGEILSFTNWATDQPTRQTPTDRCIAIAEKSWMWHLKTCSMELGFICEENRFIKSKSKELETLRHQCFNATTTKFENVIIHINSSKKNITNTKDLQFIKLGMQNITEN